VDQTGLWGFNVSFEKGSKHTNRPNLVAKEDIFSAISEYFLMCITSDAKILDTNEMTTKRFWDNCFFSG